MNADDCYGVVLDNITYNGNGGNDGPEEITTYFSGGTYGTGNFIGIRPGTPTVAGTTTFTLSNTGTNDTSGNWTLTATGGLPNTFDLAVALKASNRYAAYFFDNEAFTAGQSGVGQSGTWSIGFLKNGNTPDLSHLVVFARNGTPGTGSGSGSTQAVVPEPASLLLLGTGLGAVAARARRRKSTKSN